MIKPARLILIVIGIIVAGVLFIRTMPKNPVAIIRVVDATGKPIAGAVISPDGLRPKRINGHWGWSQKNAVKPTPVTTDAHGVARVPYPHYVFEKTETGQISFVIEHTNFCSDRPFQVVSSAPPENASLPDKLKFLGMLITGRLESKADPIVLKRGGTVKVNGYLGAKEHLLPDIHPQLASMNLPRKGYWVPTTNGELMNCRVPEGKDALRLVYFSPRGELYFSDETNFLSVPEQTNEFCLELKPAHHLSGSLDSSVPRPVTHGRVQISVESSAVNTNMEKLIWRAESAITPDGSFVFDSLPEGEAEVAVVCDGFKSTNGPGATFGNFIRPQIFAVTNQETEIVVLMEPTATCEIQVFDDQGRPLPDAEISFWPNILWNKRGSSIFMMATFDSAKLFQSGESFDWQKFRRNSPQVYYARSDARGIATVPNLPAFKQSFSVVHSNYDMPITSANNSREDVATLRPGETNRVIVKMQKKGVEYLQSPR